MLCAWNDARVTQIKQLEAATGIKRAQLSVSAWSNLKIDFIFQNLSRTNNSIWGEINKHKYGVNEGN